MNHITQTTTCYMGMLHGYVTSPTAHFSAELYTRRVCCSHLYSPVPGEGGGESRGSDATPPPTPDRGGFRGGRGAEGAEAPPFRQVITQKKATFCCSQTVKSNILRSQNAGNAISETLDVQNFPGGGACPRTPLAELRLHPRTTATRSTAPPPFQNPGSAPARPPYI